MLSMPSKSLGEHLRELRTARKLSMRALAAAAEIRSPAFIADMENGYRFPSSEVMEKLAAALEVSVRDLHLYDRRAPVAEMRALAEADPTWAFAFRKIVDAAQSGTLKPDTLMQWLSAPTPSKSPQSDLPLWS